MTKSSASQGATSKDKSPFAALTPEDRHRLGIWLPGEVRPVEKNGQTAASFGSIITQWIDVTPAMASAWLKNNVVNRTLKEDVVISYARQIMSGDFIPTHQGIAFNDVDELIDGQHFLNAIVRTGKTVKRMVTFGLPKTVEGKSFTVMDVIDSGKSRSVADQLKIQHGITNGTAISAIGGAIANVCFGERARRLSVRMILDIYHEFEKAIDWVIVHRSKQAGLKSAGVLAGFAFALTSEGRFWEGKMTISKMFTSVMTGERLNDGTAMALLRKFLTSEESALFTPSLNRGLAELVLHAIYLDLQGGTVERLDPPEDGKEYPGVLHFRSLQKAKSEKIAALFALPKLEQKAAPEPAKASERPSLDKIMAAVEGHLKIGRAIVTGRGQGDDINLARSMIVNLGMSYGYTFEDIGIVMKRTDTGTIRKLHIPKQYWGAKQTKAFEELKSKLSK